MNICVHYSFGIFVHIGVLLLTAYSQIVPFFPGARNTFKIAVEQSVLLLIRGYIKKKDTRPIFYILYRDVHNISFYFKTCERLPGVLISIRLNVSK